MNLHELAAIWNAREEEWKSKIRKEWVSLTHDYYAKRIWKWESGSYTKIGCRIENYGLKSLWGLRPTAIISLRS